MSKKDANSAVSKRPFAKGGIGICLAIPFGQEGD